MTALKKIVTAGHVKLVARFCDWCRKVKAICICHVSLTPFACAHFGSSKNADIMYITYKQLNCRGKVTNDGFSLFFFSKKKKKSNQ